MQRTASRSGTASVGWRTSVSPGGSHSARPGARRAFFARPHGRSPRPGCWPPPATPGPGAPHCPRGSGIGGGVCPKHPGVRGTAGVCGARSPTPAGGRNRIPGPASRRPYPGCATSRAVPAHTPVGARKNVSLQKREQTRPQSFVFGRMPEARKQRRDVVPGFGVDFDAPMSTSPSFIRRLRTYLMSTSGVVTENDLFLAETARNRRPGPNLRSGNIPVLWNGVKRLVCFLADSIYKRMHRIRLCRPYRFLDRDAPSCFPEACRYRFKVNRKVVHLETTTDFAHRQHKYHCRWPIGHIEQVESPTSRKTRGSGKRSRLSSVSASPHDGFT